MARFEQGNLWMAHNRADIFLITTNSTLKHNGALVMGCGMARQARDLFPGLDLALGREIATVCGHLGRCNLLVSPRSPTAKLGALQVKIHDARSALPVFIRQSALAPSAGVRTIRVQLGWAAHTYSSY